MLRKSLIKLIIVCASLAFHELWFKPVYIGWLEAQSKLYDMGNALIGYLMIVGVAWLLAYFVTRPMKKVSSA